MSSMPLASRRHWTARLPVLALLHPREHSRAVVGLLVPALVLATLAQRQGLLPTWGATALVLALLLIPGIRKWRSDAQRYGRVAMVLSVLLAAQGFHAIEHAAQMVQFHLLNWPPFASSGLISAADAEWIHFGWNWGVVAVVAYLLRGGMRGLWAWILLAWAAAHALEHSYMLLRYLDLLGELRQLGYPRLSAQGLPGVLGRDGWLARSDATQGTFLCRLPGLTTAPRIDVHFWWNSGELVALLLAAHAFLRSHPALQAASAPPSDTR